jgi:sec-independent protein translocase protein TatA
MSLPLAFISTPGPMEMLILGAIAVLLFGKRLPEVGRSLGKSLVEFKKGISGIEEEFRSATTSTYTSAATTEDFQPDVDDHLEATAPKFEPPTSEPKSEPAAEA